MKCKYCKHILAVDSGHIVHVNTQIIWTGTKTCFCGCAYMEIL